MSTWYYTRTVLIALVLLLLGMLGISGCAGQKLLAGEPLIYGVKIKSGEIIDRDIENEGVLIHKGEIITLMVNTVFIKLLEDFGNPHVLVYAEVHDDGTDNPETTFRKVIFNGENTPQGVNLGLSDRILYGPAPFKGFPIRVKFFIVELDKDQKQLASKLINAAGSMAQAVQPQFATAVGVAVQLAQALNALSEDDFELRFDLTLYPIAPTAKWTVADKILLGLPRPEPIQRQGKMIHLATPLRTGPYIILKRELPERLTPESKCLEEATLVMDHTQESFTRTYQSYKDPETKIKTDEILRYSGGYLYWILSKVLTEGVDPQVRTCENPSVPTKLAPGLRSLYHGRTYVVLTLLTGLPEGLDPQAMRTSSDRDLALLRNLLDNPGQLPLAERIGPYIDQTVSALLTAVEHRRLAIQAARRGSLDPDFRISPSYPEYWIQNLENLDILSAEQKAHGQAKNTAILSTLSEVVVNLPPIKPDDANAINCLRGLGASDFDAIEKRPGLFSLKKESLTKLNECRQSKMKISPSSPAAVTLPVK